jgi:hypothetical protein
LRKQVKITKLGLTLVISENLDGSGKNVEIPCISAVVRFGLNSIPEAVFSIASGVLAGTSKISPIHSSFSLKNQFRIKAYLNLSGEAISGNWPKDAFLLFDGFVTGVSPTVSARSSYINISATHWLSELMAASALNKWFNPTSNVDLSVLPIYRVITKPGETMAGGPTEAGAVLNQRSGSQLFISSSNIRQDLWKNAVKPTMLWMANNPSILSDTSRLNTGSGENQAVVEAINRMDGDGITSGELGFKTSSGTLEKQIAAEMGTRFFSNGFGQTLWHKLLRIADQMSFAVVPIVDTATCAPTFPFLSKPWATIYPDHYFSCSPRMGTPRLLRGVVGIGKPTSQFGEGQGTVSDLAKFDLADFSEVYKHGQILFHELPIWLSQLVVTPGSMISVNQVGRPSTAESKKLPIFAYDDELLRKYIKTIFLHAATRHRTMEIVGPMRFDIGPGSVLEVLTASAEDDNYISHFGMANSVEIKLDAQTAVATTTFSLSNIITKDEREISKNGEYAFVEDTHPFYNQAWSGTALISL